MLYHCDPAESLVPLYYVQDSTEFFTNILEQHNIISDLKATISDNWPIHNTRSVTCFKVSTRRIQSRNSLRLRVA